jgi:hypothetical protein
LIGAKTGTTETYVLGRLPQHYSCLPHGASLNVVQALLNIIQVHLVDQENKWLVHENVFVIWMKCFAIDA